MTTPSGRPLAGFPRNVLYLLTVLTRASAAGDRPGRCDPPQRRFSAGGGNSCRGYEHASPWQDPDLGPCEGRR